MDLADLQTRLEALGVTIPAAGLSAIAEMAARRVRRDTLEEKHVGVDFPANTAQVEHGLDADTCILRPLPATQQLDCDISHDSTHVRCVHHLITGDNYIAPQYEPLTIAHTLKLLVRAPRFDGTLANVPSNLEDALVYAAAIQLSITRTDITEVKTATHTVKKQVSGSSGMIDQFTHLYDEALAEAC